VRLDSEHKRYGLCFLFGVLHLDSAKGVLSSINHLLLGANSTLSCNCPARGVVMSAEYEGTCGTNFKRRTKADPEALVYLPR